MLVSFVALAASAWAEHDRGRGKSRDDRWDRWERRQDRRDARRDWRESRADVDEIIARAENAADELREDMNEALDDSRLNGTRREDEINDQVNQLENALDRLRRDFDDDHDDWNESRPEVRIVLAEARDVQSILHSWSWSTEVREDWRDLDVELRRLERIYELRRPSR